MPSLRELQLHFAEALDGAGDDALSATVRADGIPARDRVGVYRNNLHQSLPDALAAVYPVVQKLVGEGFFRQTARRYLRAHPSRSGNLHDFGGEFAAFLASLAAGRDLPYLPDVARLEWAWHRVYHAPDSRTRLDLQRLGAVSQNDWPALRFRPHPATALVASRYPVLHIWLANQVNAPADERVSLDEGGEQLLVARPRLEVEIRPLALGEYTLLQALAAGRTLARAHEQALLVDPEFDLAGALSLFIRQNVLTGFRPDPTSPIRTALQEHAHVHVH